MLVPAFHGSCLLTFGEGFSIWSATHRLLVMTRQDLQASQI